MSRPETPEEEPFDVEHQCADCGDPLEEADAIKSEGLWDVPLCVDCQLVRKADDEAIFDCQCPGGEELGPCHCPACSRGGEG